MCYIGFCRGRLKTRLITSSAVTDRVGWLARCNEAALQCLADAGQHSGNCLTKAGVALTFNQTPLTCSASNFPSLANYSTSQYCC